MILHSFQGDRDGPHLLITAGVHGDEFEPIAAVRRLRDRLHDDSHQRPAFAGTITLIPVVNESAYHCGSRVGSDGLDLARTCPGQANGSETERVAHELSTLICEADYYIDLHTGGTELQIVPLAGYMLHPDPQVLNQQRGMAQAFNLPIVWGTTSELDGRSLSVARDAGVPAIYCESGGGGSCDDAGVNAYVTGCLNVMGHVGMTEGSVPVSQVLHTVEDGRPDSGHLQLSYQSPVDGFFEPAVEPGQTIEAGEPLGTLYDLQSTLQTTVVSTSNGIVIVLRTFPRTAAGDSLAVVLEVPPINA